MINFEQLFKIYTKASLLFVPALLSDSLQISRTFFKIIIRLFVKNNSSQQFNYTANPQ